MHSKSISLIWDASTCIRYDCRSKNVIVSWQWQCLWVDKNVCLVLRMSTFMYDHINHRAMNAMCFFFLSPWKKTLDQLIKLIFSFNKLYSLLYHVLQQNFLLFEKKKTHWFIQKKVKGFLCNLNLLLFKYRQNKWLLTLLSCARLLANKGLWI